MSKKRWIGFFLGLLLISTAEVACAWVQVATVSQPTNAAEAIQAANGSHDHAGSAGQALSLLFDLRRAPTAKSMGLLQGNFLDAIDVHRSLQLAIVIDTSESMSLQLESIRNNLKYLLGDLERILDGSVDTAIVTFSDVGEKKIPVVIHSQLFTDAESAQSIIDQLSITTGQPYFPEAVDLGVQRALSELPWSDDANVERWVLLIGDAPPYEATFNDPPTGAKRWYETERLVDLANQKNIHVHCLLCTSRESERNAFENLLDDTRNFMAKLSSDTGGLMLDMSYTQVREALAESASRLRSQYVRVGHISKTDIQNALSPANEVKDDEHPLRIIVTPFLAWEDLTFFQQRPEVQIATELKNVLQRLPHTRVVQTRQLEEQIERLKIEGIPFSEWPQALCLRLRAEVILTGQMKSANEDFAITVELHDARSRQPLASAKLTASAQQLARQIVGQLAQTRNPPVEIITLIDRLQRYASEQQIDNTQMGVLGKLNSTERRLLLAGIAALEQATGYALADPDGVSLLESAEESLVQFLQEQPQYPYALMLLSSAQFNLASAFEAAGWLDEAREKFAESKLALQQAFQTRKELVEELLKLEVEGDYNLLVRQEFETSIDRYIQIISQSSKSPLNCALHAHWMLAGIRSGDWGVGDRNPQVVNLVAAREHLIQILAHWPESAQAELIRKNMNWDPQMQQTRTPYLAHLGESLIAQH